MSKALATTIAAVGTASTAVGGYYLVKGSNGSVIKGKIEITTSPIPNLLANISLHSATDTTLTPKDLSAFKMESVKDKPCVSDVFNGSTVDLNSSSGSQDNFSSDFFGNAPTESSSADSTKGCLIINYVKNNTEDGKGSGAFTGTGVFINNNKGLINFNSATTDEEQKLKLDGGFYLVEKQSGDSANTGKVKWEDKIDGGSFKKISSGELPSHFPQLNSKLPASDTPNKDYGGFLDGEEELKDKTPLIYKGTWKYTVPAGENKVGIHEGTKNLTWWDNLYSKTKNKSFDLASKLSAFKGTGEKVTTSPSA